MSIEPDYKLAQRLIDKVVDGVAWVGEVDRLTNVEIIALYQVSRTHLSPVHWPAWDLVLKNVQLIMRVRFAQAVEEGKL